MKQTLPYFPCFVVHLDLEDCKTVIMRDLTLQAWKISIQLLSLPKPCNAGSRVYDIPFPYVILHFKVAKVRGFSEPEKQVVQMSRWKSNRISPKRRLIPYDNRPTCDEYNRAQLIRPSACHPVRRMTRSDKSTASKRRHATVASGALTTTVRRRRRVRARTHTRTRAHSRRRMVAYFSKLCDVQRNQLPLCTRVRSCLEGENVHCLACLNLPKNVYGGV